LDFADRNETFFDNALNVGYRFSLLRARSIDGVRNPFVPISHDPKHLIRLRNLHCFGQGFVKDSIYQLPLVWIENDCRPTHVRRQLLSDVVAMQ
jgi:hypothetical protein